MAPRPVADKLRFDGYELDVHAGELRKHGVRLCLRGQPLQLLEMLLERAGQVVTREELQSRIWPAKTFVDFDHGLHNAMARIRQVLGDSPETPRYIETLPRHGYRFIGALEEKCQTPRLAEETGRQIVLTREQDNPWANTFDERFAVILKLQSEIANAIAREVDVRLRPPNPTRLTRSRSLNPEAHECYFKGRYCWNKRTEDSLQQALEYFQQTVQHDSTYADGYLGLADSLNILGYYNLIPPEEAFPRAKAAAIRALQLDDSLGEAHATLGVVKRDFEWNWPGAEDEFKRAIELNAGHAESHHWYATLLNMLGRTEPALNAMLAALELDPISLAINTDLGRTFYFARQYDRAVKQLKKTMEFDPTFGITYLWLGQVFEQQGLLDEAISHLEKGTSVIGGSAYALAQLAHGYARAGRKNDAQAILQQLRELSQRRYVSPYDIAMIHVGLGDHAEAFAALNQAAEERCHWLGYLRVEPQLDALRTDTRFADLLSRLGIPAR
jgi:DNA-binding winged helix-turn-helix (wHTH) protein/Flp pilus assembly protein TadD